MLSSVDVNSLGEIVSPRRTPLLNLIFSHSLCRFVVTELFVSFRISMYTSSITCSCNDVNLFFSSLIVTWKPVKFLLKRKWINQGTTGCCLFSLKSIVHV